MSNFQLSNLHLAEPIDQRTAARYAICVSVELIFEDGRRARALTRDISASGIFILVAKDLELGNFLRFLVTFPREITTSSRLFALCDGAVVRRESATDCEGVAVKIQKYQFLNSVA
jgi:hypothetical protein